MVFTVITDSRSGPTVCGRGREGVDVDLVLVLLGKGGGSYVPGG